MTKIKKIFYDELTFPEVRVIVAEERVSLLPVGTVEQHGHHCPLKVDRMPDGSVPFGGGACARRRHCHALRPLRLRWVQYKLSGHHPHQ